MATAGCAFGSSIVLQPVMHDRRGIIENELVSLYPELFTESRKFLFEELKAAVDFDPTWKNLRARGIPKPVADHADGLFEAVAVNLDVLARDVGNELLVAIGHAVE